ncbi:hypothetical protein GJ496_007448 [Pomphorhynchus laevis]|nr:hypothetical protein GJ496_007448 [Pomphorhynchus laevis]
MMYKDEANSISVRIHSLEYRMTFDCYSKCKRSKQKHPSILIFGRTDQSNSVCVHVYEFYPYLLMPISENCSDAHVFEILSVINKKLSSCIDTVELNGSPRNHIHSYVKVQKMSIYGYHENYVDFIKINFYCPHTVKRCADLLSSGQILEQVFQPYESHIPYNLQFLIDHNLYGMQFVDIKAAKLRRPAYSDLNSEGTVVFSNFSSAKLIDINCEVQTHWYNSTPYNLLPSEACSTNACATTCQYEFDVMAENIKRSNVLSVDAFINPALNDIIGYGSENDSFCCCNQSANLITEDKTHDVIEYKERFKTVLAKLNEESKFPKNQDDNEESYIENSQSNFLIKLLQSEFTKHGSVQNMTDMDISGDVCSGDKLSRFHSSLLNFDNIMHPNLKTTELPIVGRSPDTSQIYTSRSFLNESVSRQISISGISNISSQSFRWFTSNQLLQVNDISTHNPQHFQIQDEKLRNYFSDKTYNWYISRNKLSFYDIDFNSTENNHNQFTDVNSLKTELNELYSSNQQLIIASLYVHCNLSDSLVIVKSIFVTYGVEINSCKNKLDTVSICLMPNDVFFNSMLTESSCYTTGHSMCVIQFNSEFNLILGFLYVLQQLNPDIVVCHETQNSIEVINKRAAQLGVNDNSNVYFGRLLRKSSKANKNGNNPTLLKCEVPKQPRSDHEKKSWSGRIILEMWSIVRSQLSLRSYSFENAYYSLFGERCQRMSTDCLDLFLNTNPIHFVNYYLLRTIGQLRILSKLNFVNQTSELARVFGIEFSHVLTRGSQYRVESFLLRVAKSSESYSRQQYAFMSPSNEQRQAMRAPESIPIVLEPFTNLYTDCVAVFDFQSLYPSLIIAYNLCYSTCIGKITEIENGISGYYRLGCDANFKYSFKNISSDDVLFTSAGVGFVKTNIRKGILPIMLSQILQARRTVKRQIKHLKDTAESETCQDELLNLEHKQLGLKLLANVTYGYTAANFSGRMPCVEIADSVVQLGRYHLQQAITILTNFENMNTKVVYGDTDSVFVQLPSHLPMLECFDVCDRMTEAVTSTCPKPMRLMFEKIYKPCVLLAKKHYAGLAFENRKTKTGIMEIKGLEAVRRDGCTLQAEIVKRSLEILFANPDKTVQAWPHCQLADYLSSTFADIRNSKISPEKYVIAKEYRGRHRYRVDGNQIPAIRIANRRCENKDWSIANAGMHAEPKVGDRVPYVITTFDKGTLSERAREPCELITTSSSVRSFFSKYENGPFDKIDINYYLHKQIIPPLNRILSTFNQNASQLIWKSHFNTKRVMSSVDRSKKSRRFGLGLFSDTMNQCIKCNAGIPLVDAMKCQNYECSLFYRKCQSLSWIYF